MARRPKASNLDLVDSVANIGLNAVQLRRQSKMRDELENVRRQNVIGTAYTLKAIEGLYDLHLAHGQKMAEVEEKLGHLAEISWNIASYLDRKEQREKFIGDMRFYIHNTNRTLDEIDGYSEAYPEYALLLVNRIIRTIDQKDVKVEHFSQVSMDEMAMAQKLLDRVYDKKATLMSRM